MSDKFDRIAINDIIENLREKMHSLAEDYGLAHPQVLEVSQLLDCEISKFYRQGAKC